jgi:UDP-2-acetamido-2-deoxy-ribo-hexuluronate aminotransferase
MNAPAPKITEFVDLKAQYAALRHNIDERIKKVLQHGRFIMGPEVNELEERLAGFTAAKHCITCASGTEALLIALMALDVRPGDEVITTPFTFVATAEMIVLLGAKPVFVDIEPDTCNIDASKIEAAVTARTRAIMPVSLYGQPADMDEINTIAARHGLAVIEDAAQSFGALYNGRRSCNLSTIGCTSFFPSKPLGCYGDGGALFTNDDRLATAMREIRTHGQEKRYYHTRIGVGGRMDTIQCAVVLAKLERFEWEIARRMEIGRRYEVLLAERTPDLNFVRVRPNRTSVYAQYTVITTQRDRLQSELKLRGVPTAIHYPVSLHQQPAYQAYQLSSDLVNSELLASSVISLPVYPDLKAEIQERVVDYVREALSR